MSAQKVAQLVSRMDCPSDEGDLSQQSHEEWIFLNRNTLDVKLLRHDRLDLRRPFPPMLAERLDGARIGALSRRGKYLLIELDGSGILLLHLGMSGRITAGDKDTAEAVHDHVVLTLDDGTVVRFNDPRRFGLLDYLPKSEIDAHPLLKGMGPEPLGPQFDSVYLATKLAGKMTPIKAALLDQKIVAGLGNIYVCYFQHRWAVYGKEGEPCPGCTCAEGVRRIAQSGRSTFFCAKKQR